MTFNEFAAVAALVLVTVGPVVFFMWTKQRQRIGKIRCNRCGHCARAKGEFRPFVGIKPVCGKCGSENWTAAVSPPPLT